MTNADLYRRGAATAFASWEAYARGSHDAAIRRMPGVAAAVFPNEPERTVYNNAILGRNITPPERRSALAALEDVYAEAGVTRFAVWVHESDQGMCAELARCGYTLDSATRAMGMVLADSRLSRPELELASMAWEEYLRTFGLPAGLLHEADQSATVGSTTS